jgi:Ankyrin repeats (3 copies)
VVLSDEKRFQELVRSGIFDDCVNTPVPSGLLSAWTGYHLLTIAARKGSLPMVRELLDLGALVDPPYRAERGAYPLHAAVQAGNALIVEELLKRDADANAGPTLGDNPLGLALHLRAPVPIIRILLEHGADVENASVYGCRPYRSAFEFLLDINRLSQGWYHSALRTLIELRRLEANRFCLRTAPSVLERFVHQSKWNEDDLWYRKVGDEARFCIAYFAEQGEDFDFDFNPSKCQCSCKADFLRQILFHTPGSDLSNYIVDKCSVMEFIGNRILYHLLNPCESRQMRCSDASIADFIKTMRRCEFDFASWYSYGTILDVLLRETVISEVPGIFSALDGLPPIEFSLPSMMTFLQRSRSEMLNRIKIAAKILTDFSFEDEDYPAVVMRELLLRKDYVRAFGRDASIVAAYLTDERGYAEEDVEDCLLALRTAAINMCLEKLNRQTSMTAPTLLSGSDHIVLQYFLYDPQAASLEIRVPPQLTKWLLQNWVRNQSPHLINLAPPPL